MAIKKEIKLRPRKNILVIEDDSELIEIIKTHLEILGLNVITALDGLMGIHKCGLQKFDAILCDISMPRLNGSKAVSLIKKSSYNQKTPIFILSGHIDRFVLSKIRDHITKVYVKPFPVDQLCLEINNLI